MVTGLHLMGPLALLAELQTAFADIEDIDKKRLAANTVNGCGNFLTIVEIGPY
jgi:hypothetical protein